MERALSNKIKMMRQMAFAITLPRFNDLVHSVTPVFLLINQFSSFSEKKWRKSIDQKCEFYEKRYSFICAADSNTL